MTPNWGDRPSLHIRDIKFDSCNGNNSCNVDDSEEKNLLDAERGSKTISRDIFLIHRDQYYETFLLSPMTDPLVTAKRSSWI